MSLLNGRKAIVDEVLFCTYSNFEIRVRLFKKDGSPRVYNSNAYNSDEWKLTQARVSDE